MWVFLSYFPLFALLQFLVTGRHSLGKSLCSDQPTYGFRCLYKKENVTGIRTKYGLLVGYYPDQQQHYRSHGP